MITFCLMVLVAFFAYRFYKSEKSSMESVYDDIFLGDPHTTPPKPNPNFMRDYPENRTGSFQFNPSTILESLDQGKDVFTVEDADAVETEYDGIGWTQSDFLRVANALSQKVWHEPLDMNGWMVYNIIFSGGCHDNIAKLNLFDITYYKTIKTGWQMVYTARLITISPRMGVVDWAGDGTFSTPFVFGWENINLTKFKTTADQAVQIAEENGAKAARVNKENKCNLNVYTRQDPNRNYEYNWYVDYDLAEFSVFINPFTGEVLKGR
jgi:hypothetical protein